MERYGNMPGQQQHSLLPQIFPNTCIDNAGPKHMHHSCPWRFFIVKSGSQARLGAMGLLLQISTLEQPRITQARQLESIGWSLIASMSGISVSYDASPLKYQLPLLTLYYNDPKMKEDTYHPLLSTQLYHIIILYINKSTSTLTLISITGNLWKHGYIHLSLAPICMEWLIWSLANWSLLPLPLHWWIWALVWLLVDKSNYKMGTPASYYNNYKMGGAPSGCGCCFLTQHMPNGFPIFIRFLMVFCCNCKLIKNKY